MNRLSLIIAIAFSIISCNKPVEATATKTAYVDTSKLMSEYSEAKDVAAKYKSKAEEMGKELEAEVARFKTEAASFQKNAQLNGQAWAQQKGAELQKREQQLQYAQQSIAQQLQQESGVEMDSVVSGVKKFIKTYGKEQGYTYIYGTGEAATILYAQDKYDITNEVIKLLNNKYKSVSKSATDSKLGVKKEIEKVEKEK